MAQPKDVDRSTSQISELWPNDILIIHDRITVKIIVIWLKNTISDFGILRPPIFHKSGVITGGGCGGVKETWSPGGSMLFWDPSAGVWPLYHSVKAFTRSNLLAVFRELKRAVKASGPFLWMSKRKNVFLSEGNLSIISNTLVLLINPSWYKMCRSSLQGNSAFSNTLFLLIASLCCRSMMWYHFQYIQNKWPLTVLICS